jgi:hypothetical protein
MFGFCSVYLCGFEKNSDGLISRSSSSLTPREPIVMRTNPPGLDAGSHHEARTATVALDPLSPVWGGRTGGRRDDSVIRIRRRFQRDRPDSPARSASIVTVSRAAA